MPYSQRPWSGKHGHAPPPGFVATQEGGFPQRRHPNQTLASSLERRKLNKGFGRRVIWVNFRCDCPASTSGLFSTPTQCSTKGETASSPSSGPRHYLGLRRSTRPVFSN